MVCVVPEGPGASGSRSKCSSARGPESSRAEHKTAIKNKNTKPLKKMRIVKKGKLK